MFAQHHQSSPTTETAPQPPYRPAPCYGTTGPARPTSSSKRSHLHRDLQCRKARLDPARRHSPSERLPNLTLFRFSLVAFAPKCPIRFVDRQQKVAEARSFIDGPGAAESGPEDSKILLRQKSYRDNAVLGPRCIR